MHFIPWSGTVLRPVYVIDLHSLLPTLMPTCITHFFIQCFLSPSTFCLPSISIHLLSSIYFLPSISIYTPIYFLSTSNLSISTSIYTHIIHLSNLYLTIIHPNDLPTHQLSKYQRRRCYIRVYYGLYFLYYYVRYRICPRSTSPSSAACHFNQIYMRAMEMLI